MADGGRVARSYGGGGAGGAGRGCARRGVAGVGRVAARGGVASAGARTLMGRSVRGLVNAGVRGVVAAGGGVACGAGRAHPGGGWRGDDGAAQQGPEVVGVGAAAEVVKGALNERGGGVALQQVHRVAVESRRGGLMGGELVGRRKLDQRAGVQRRQRRHGVHCHRRRLQRLGERQAWAASRRRRGGNRRLARGARRLGASGGIVWMGRGR